jgi:hypothetical protein
VDRGELERRFGTGEALGEIPDESGDHGATFPDGSPAATCTSWARQVAAALGSRAAVFGFSAEDNPSSEIASDVGGHDFAVVDGRWIVDGWASDWDSYSDRAVHDLEDPSEAGEIRRLYGDRARWSEWSDAAGEFRRAEERGRPLGESKAALTFPELELSTRHAGFKTEPADGVSGLKVEDAKLMRYIRYTADAGGERPSVVFFDYARPEVADRLSLGSLLGLTTGDTRVAEVDATTQPVRVTCTCAEYGVLFAHANYDHDAHYGMRPKFMDGRDHGYRQAQPNGKGLPGVCGHLEGLYQYLRRINRVQG